MLKSQIDFKGFKYILGFKYIKQFCTKSNLAISQK